MRLLGFKYHEGEGRMVARDRARILRAPPPLLVAARSAQSRWSEVERRQAESTDDCGRQWWTLNG